jgi:hypothetical protein
VVRVRGRRPSGLFSVQKMKPATGQQVSKQKQIMIMRPQGLHTYRYYLCECRRPQSVEGEANEASSRQRFGPLARRGRLSDSSRRDLRPLRVDSRRNDLQLQSASRSGDGDGVGDVDSIRWASRLYLNPLLRILLGGRETKDGQTGMVLGWGKSIYQCPYRRRAVPGVAAT